MTAPDDLAPTLQDAAAAIGQRPARFAARPLVLACAALVVGFGGLVIAVDLTGSAAAGDSSVTLALAAFPAQDGESSGHGAPSFRSRREIGGHLIADPALIEDSAQGPLPRIADDGRLPLSAYAGGFDAGDKRPKIALVIRGLGIGASNTAVALERLAPAVTFAFPPFAPALQDDIDKARGSGHEALIEVPMEPFDFPDSDPGPHALLVAASAEENAKRLAWVLSRATGYAGVMNLLGGRFMGEENAIEPVLDQIAKRGLMFFDNGASSTSVAITSARHVRTPLAIGMLTLDTTQTQAAIDAKLAELETAARQDGFAIGVGSAYPVTIARAAEWAANAAARGFQIVPVSALAKIPGAGEAETDQIARNDVAPAAPRHTAAAPATADH